MPTNRQESVQAEGHLSQAVDGHRHIERALLLHLGMKIDAFHVFRDHELDLSVGRRIEVDRLGNKSSLGFSRHRFKRFPAVEVWASVAITTFLYLGWYRAKQLRGSRLAAEGKRWWILQRTHGLCQVIRLATEEAETHSLGLRLGLP